MAAPGPELILGMARDPALGPLIVAGAGGTLAEYLSERSVALPPVAPAAPAAPAAAARMITGLRVAEILAGVRGRPPFDMDAVNSALVSFRSWCPTWLTTWTPSTSTRSSAHPQVSSPSTP
jgi:hypothetical protein